MLMLMDVNVNVNVNVNVTVNGCFVMGFIKHIFLRTFVGHHRYGRVLRNAVP